MVSNQNGMSVAFPAPHCSGIHYPLASPLRSIRQLHHHGALMLTAIDTSMIGPAQVFDLCLQRSNRLAKIIPSRAKSGEAWLGLMQAAVVEHRQTILDAVTVGIEDIFAKIAPQIEKFAPKRLADIGCGQAFIDLLIHRQFGCDLILIDIEQSDGIHFGFNDTGAGYADLANARAFLVANGVPDQAITTINPRHAPLADFAPVDMAISLLSCGFHYPVETYDAFFKSQVTKAILLDCRNQKGGKQALKAYGAVREVGEEQKHKRILCTKL